MNYKWKLNLKAYSKNFEKIEVIKVNRAESRKNPKKPRLIKKLRNMWTERAKGI
jgi:hypothetical protein